MDIPSEWGRLAGAEKTLSEKDLSLDKMHEVESTLTDLINSSDKTSELAVRLFDRVEDRRASLVDREVTLSQETFKVASAVAAFRLQRNSLTFEEAAEQIIELNQQVEGLSNMAPSTHSLQDVMERSKQELEHLHFVFVFPQIDELERDSFQLNMAYNLSQVAAELCETDGFEPFEKLSPNQRGEVLKLVGSAPSPEGLAHGIEQYLDSLLSQAYVAESYFHSRESADGDFERLPQEVQRRIEYLETTFGLLRTEALMYSLDERMD